MCCALSRNGAVDMTSSCPQPPDMDDCKSRKKRCLSGPCVGFTYTDGEECGPGAVFDANTCQCEQQFKGGVYYLTGTSSWPGAAPRYNAFNVADPYFSDDGELVVTVPAFTFSESGSGVNGCHTCENESGQIVSTIEESPCWRDVGAIPIEAASSLYAFYYSGPMTRKICSWVCGPNPNFDNSSGTEIYTLNRLAVTDGGYRFLYAGSVISFGRNEFKCSEPEELRERTITWNLTYIGPGVVSDYYSAADPGDNNLNSSTPLVPDLPGPG